MKDKILQQKNKIIIAAVVIGAILGGYFYYSSSSSSSTNTSTEVDVNLFTPEVKNFYLIKSSIVLDDSFMKGKNADFFNQLKSYSQDIPLKAPTGRHNPFVPYVTP